MACCLRCGRWISPSNRSGYCQPCRAVTRCRVCARTKEGRGHWCPECRDGLAIFARAMRSFLPCPRPGPELLAERIALYEPRASAGVPLFGPCEGRNG